MKCYDDRSRSAARAARTSSCRRSCSRLRHADRRGVLPADQRGRTRFPRGIAAARSSRCTARGTSRPWRRASRSSRSAATIRRSESTGRPEAQWTEFVGGCQSADGARACRPTGVAKAPTARCSSATTRPERSGGSGRRGRSGWHAGSGRRRVFQRRRETLVVALVLVCIVERKRQQRAVEHGALAGVACDPGCVAGTCVRARERPRAVVRVLATDMRPSTRGRRTFSCRGTGARRTSASRTAPIPRIRHLRLASRAARGRRARRGSRTRSARGARTAPTAAPL